MHRMANKASPRAWISSPGKGLQGFDLPFFQKERHAFHIAILTLFICLYKSFSKFLIMRLKKYISFRFILLRRARGMYSAEMLHFQIDYLRL